jgi:diguanylate cyclase (GGDEF)-like protein
MNLDVNTLFLVTMHVEIMLGLLLFFAWTQNFSKRELAWWGSAHLLRALSIVLLGMHGSVPDSLSVDLGNAVLFASFALTWSGARVFERRAPEPWLSLVGVAAWLLACRMPSFAAVPELRLLVGTAIVAAYTWLTAYEFWRGRDETLVSRWPAIFMLFADGAAALLRSPVATPGVANPADRIAMSGWLDLLSLQGLLFTISTSFILLAMAKERNEHRHRTAATTDPLTGIANRRGLLEQITASQRSISGNRPTAVLLFDIDHFKRVNDSHGHAVGDRTLQLFAETAKAQIGEAGMIGRWGGDEFIAVMFDTSLEIALTVGERIQHAFEEAAAGIQGRMVGATISTGLAFSAHGPFELPRLMLQADQALYRAKQQGRNRIAVAERETYVAPDETTQPKVMTLDSRNAA